MSKAKKSRPHRRCAPTSLNRGGEHRLQAHPRLRLPQSVLVARTPARFYPPLTQEAPALMWRAGAEKPTRKPELPHLPGAGTSSACATPLASSTDATSHPSAGCFFCWSVSLVSVNDADPPDAIEAKSPLETDGVYGLIDAEPVKSTNPPGTIENAATL